MRSCPERKRRSDGKATLAFRRFRIYVDQKRRARLSLEGQTRTASAEGSAKDCAQTESRLTERRASGFFLPKASQFLDAAIVPPRRTSCWVTRHRCDLRSLRKLRPVLRSP